MTEDFKCYASPQQNTGVFILNGDVFAVIVCDVFLLFFTFSALLLLFSCSDQRISICRLSALPQIPLALLFLHHESPFTYSDLITNINTVRVCCLFNVFPHLSFSLFSIFSKTWFHFLFFSSLTFSFSLAPSSVCHYSPSLLISC